MTKTGTKTGTKSDSEREGRSEWRAAAAWLAVAAVLRFVALGRFSLWSDEVYSIEDAVAFGRPEMEPATLGYPLFYVLEKVVLLLFGLGGKDASPLGLQMVARIVPAAAGALAAAAAFLAPRGFLERRERHLLAAFITFSPWLLFFSQFARFYTLALLLSTVATFAVLRAERVGSVRAGMKAAGLMLLAVLAHPTALLLLGGLVAAALANSLLRIRPFSKALLPVALLPVALLLPAAFRSEVVVRSLWYRFTVQDAAKESVRELLLGIGYNVGPAIAALALLGLASLWRRDRGLAVQVVVATGLPTLLLIGLAALGKSVEQRYLLPVLPLALLPAAVFLREIGDAVAARGRLAVPVLALVPWVPGILSEYVDGDRHDLAGATALVRAQLQPGDGLIAEGHALVLRYMPADFPSELCLEAPPPNTPEEQSQYADLWRSCSRVWIVIPAEWEETTDDRGSFHQWCWNEGRFVQEFWPRRWDYHQNRLRVFLVLTKETRRWWSGWTQR